MPPTAEQLGQRAIQLGLITDRDLQVAWAELGTKSVDLNTFSSVLIRREYLTNYQLERLIEGRTSGFFFGDYKALYLVGRGTFARVYRAKNIKTGEIVAVKVLRSKYSSNPESFGQFIREGELGKKLNHPNIIKILEVYSRANLHFMVMEFIEGQSLRDFIRIRKTVDPPEAISIMRDISAGLQYAFENGLTHRDLKLTNIMIGSNRRAKLADFGLAGIDANINLDDTLVDIPNPRTVDYAGLEKATGVKKDDTRSDIYFAGCIFYHLLTGESPLVETNDRLQRMSRQRFLDVVPISSKMPDIPSGVAMVVNKAMTLDVHKRYQTPGELLRDLVTLEKRMKEDPVKGMDSSILTSASEPALANRTVMLVEGDPRIQDVFRDAFKKAGFRVLVVSEPKRASERLFDNRQIADCIIINAQNTGDAAVDVFNELPQMDHGDIKIRSILLLAKNQTPWYEKIQRDSYRHVLQLPLTMKQLGIAIARLLSIK